MKEKRFYKAKAPKPKLSDRAGFASRKRAAELVEWVLFKRRPIDEALDLGTVVLPDQDRALARQIASTTLRHYHWLEALLAERLDKGLPPGLPHLHSALLIGAAQILFLDVADHAAVDLSVSLVEHDKKAIGMKGLANAVLRGIAREKDVILRRFDPINNLAPWLQQGWIKAYGEDETRAIAKACLSEPALDVSVKDNPDEWAKRLGGFLTPTGSVRLIAQSSVPQMDGFEEGQWWVQDAAAALPARLFPDIKGKSVADFCAAPGGKTAQLASRGAIVTAFDRNERRLERLFDNMQRLALEVEIVVADATEAEGEFDHILIDAPCSATGTLRGHPDVGILKTAQDVAQLARMQARLIDRAVHCLKSNGTLVYCTCSLEPEEGEWQIEQALQRHKTMSLSPVLPHELNGQVEFITAKDMVRTLPSHWPHESARLGGLDGFFAARLVKRTI